MKQVINNVAASHIWVFPVIQKLNTWTPTAMPWKNHLCPGTEFARKLRGHTFVICAYCAYHTNIIVFFACWWRHHVHSTVVRNLCEIGKSGRQIMKTIYRVSIKSLYNLKKILKNEMMRSQWGLFYVNQYFIKFLLTLKFIVSEKIS